MWTARHLGRMTIVILIVTLPLISTQCTSGEVQCSERPLLLIAERYRQCASTHEQRGDAGVCLTPLLRETLDSVRGSFSSGLRLTEDGWPGQLEPLLINIATSRARSRRRSPTVTEAKLTGLSTAQLQHIHLNRSHASITLSFPRLQASGRLQLSGGLFPIRPRLTVDLFETVATVSGRWSMNQQVNETIVLKDTRVQLKVKDFRVQILNLLSMGASVEQKLNDASQEIIEFIRPSFETLIANRIALLQNKYSDQLVKFKRQLLS